MATRKAATKGATKRATKSATRSATRHASKRLRAAGPSSVRMQAAAATREGILKAAIKVFAKHGFAGGRVEQISRAAKSYDRMIYYYFGSKEGLWVAVIEETYRRFNEAESTLQLDLTQPVQALDALVHFICTYYQAHPEFITLLNSENLHQGRHISRTRRAGEYSSPALTILQQVLDSGARQGVFRPQQRARDVYLMIAAMGYFYLSNRFTLSAFLGEDLQAPEALAQWQAYISQAVQRTVAR
jgi:TetR/AcrR family transcriptional regulator, upper aerobic nicotinate degradation pathway regulator